MIYSGQATILIKKTSTPSVTSIETDVVVAKTNTKPFFHVGLHFKIPTNVEEFGVEGEFHGVSLFDCLSIHGGGTSVDAPCATNQTGTASRISDRISYNSDTSVPTCSLTRSQSSWNSMRDIMASICSKLSSIGLNPDDSYKITPREAPGSVSVPLLKLSQCHTAVGL